MRRKITGLLLGVALAIVGTTTSGASTPDQDRFEQEARTYYAIHGSVNGLTDQWGFTPDMYLIGGEYHTAAARDRVFIMHLDSVTGVPFVSASLTSPMTTWHVATLAQARKWTLDNWSIVHALAPVYPEIAAMAFTVCAVDFFFYPQAVSPDASVVDAGMFSGHPSYAAAIQWLSDRSPDMRDCFAAYDLEYIGRVHKWLRPLPEVLMPL